MSEHPGAATGHRHVFLVGFMAVGKTTVGRLLADVLGRPFVDLDAVVEDRAGKPIAAIFADDGEPAFRRLEADALAQVADRPAAVVATGGGAPCFGDNLAVMRRRGLVVALTAPLEIVRGRVADPSTRPLPSAEPDELRSLHDRRIPAYRQAHACVRTEDDPPEVVAKTIARLLATAAIIPDHALGHAAVVALAERAYPIVVAPGLLDGLGDAARAALGPDVARVGLVSDDHVAPLYGRRAADSLERAGFTVITAEVPAGEASKCFAEYCRLAEELAAAGLDRRSAIVALGGGMVGDLAGFVAATLFRGVACIQVPTTVLAMVDSSIGGKTGINIAAGKNLVGAFWQPRLVAADPAVLATLPARERRAAFGELVKYGLLDGEDLYAAVEAIAASLCADGAGPPGDRPGNSIEPLADVIRRCAAVKSWIVSRDEREQTGERALLNLGHTVGHAIEAAAGYGELLHGEAVALGLVAACRVSARLDMCDPALEARVAKSLRAAGLDSNVDPWLREDVLARIGVDKKRTGKRIRFVVVEDVGRCSTTSLELAELDRILRA